MYKVEWKDIEGNIKYRECYTHEGFLDLVTALTEGMDFVSIRWTHVE